MYSRERSTARTSHEDKIVLCIAQVAVSVWSTTYLHLEHPSFCLPIWLCPPNVSQIKLCSIFRESQYFWRVIPWNWGPWKTNPYLQWTRKLVSLWDRIGLISTHHIPKPAAKSSRLQTLIEPFFPVTYSEVHSDAGCTAGNPCCHPHSNAYSLSCRRYTDHIVDMQDKQRWREHRTLYYTSINGHGIGTGVIHDDDFMLQTSRKLAIQIQSP